MNACCQSCKRPVSTKVRLSSTSTRRTTSINRRISCPRIRSTKGASKARRDDINGEIRNMRQLLPIRPQERERLSYLHSMAAICTYIRKACYYPDLQAEGSGSPLPCADFLQALPGFIVAMTAEGRLLSVSENVEDYLGYSMVDVLQWDTFYDMVDSADVEAVRSHLEASVLGTETAFVCRMHTSKSSRLRRDSGGCSMLVRGRFQAPLNSSQPHSAPRSSFIALCTPTVDRLTGSDAPATLGHFHSSHWLDMSFRQVSDSVLFHLGYPEEQLVGQSWYGLLHPDDLSIGEGAHRRLQEGDEAVSVETVLRLQHKDLSWVWLYVWAARHSATGRQEVSCTNYVISETEASFLRRKTGGEAPGTQRRLPQEVSRSLGWDAGVSRSYKRQREELSFGEESWAKRVKAPFPQRANHSWDPSSPVFPTTPPLSPDSTHSDISTEAQSPDFCYDHPEDFLPPQESLHPSPPCLASGLSPRPSLQIMSDTHFYPCGLGVASSQSPESSYGFPACFTNSQLVPEFLSRPGPCGVTSGVAFGPEDLGLPVHPPEGAGPFLPAHSSALLTPEPSPTADGHFLYSQEELAEISVLAQQISSLANSFHMCHSQSPAQGLFQAARPAQSHPFSSAPSSTISSALSPTLSPTPSPTLSFALSPTLSPTPSPTLSSALSPTLSPTPSPTLSSALSSIPSPAPSSPLSSALNPTLSPSLSPALSLPCEYPEAFAPPSPPVEAAVEPELELDEDVIACILQHLDQSPGPHPRPPSSAPLMHTCPPHGPVGFITALEDKLPPYLTLDPCTLTSGRHGNNNELYQLRQYP